MSQNERGLDFRQLNYQWLIGNLWRDTEEHSKSPEEQVNGYVREAKESHDEG